MFVLPFALDRYFKQTAHSHEVPLSQMVPTRARADGIAKAFGLMACAYIGETERREPLTLKKRHDGRWDIVSGNSTYAVAKAQGWPALIAQWS